MNAAAKRIVIVSSRFPYGNQEAYLSTELGELTQYFESITVVPLRSPRAIIAQRVPPGVNVLPWSLASREVLRRAMLALRANPRRAFGAIGELIRSHDPGRAKNLCVVVKGLALAHWMMEHRIDHVHAYWISAPATVAWLAATVSGRTWSSTAHRWDIYERNAFDVKARSASFVRTISSRGTADLEKSMPAIAGRVLQVRLGTNVPPTSSCVVRTGEPFHIVCPAALVPVKGHADLLAAVARLRTAGIPVRCTLAGTGPLRESLEHRVRTSGLSDIVTFTGSVPQLTLHQWYRDGRFAAVVLASRNEGASVMEGMPSAIIEAMAFTVPVVATNSGSIGELVDNACGRLVEAGNPGALAEALTDVYNDPLAAHARAERAYAIVARQHDVRVQMRTFAAALAGTGNPA